MLQLDAGLEDDEEFCLVKRILGKAAVGQWMGSSIRKGSPWSNRLETICGEIADDCNAKAGSAGRS